MSQANTIAVLGDKPLELKLRDAFPGFVVIGARVAEKVLDLIAQGAIGMLATQVRKAGAPDVQIIRNLARNAASHQIPAVFIAHSSNDVFKTLGEIIAAPTIGVAYDIDEVRPVMNLLRQRAHRATTQRTVPLTRPADSDLDEHPLVQESTSFLRNKASGRLDCKRVADFYGEPLKRFADALGVSPSAVSQTPDSKKYQDFLSYFEKAARVVSLMEDKNQFGVWVRTPNKELKGEAPLDLLWGGPAKAEKLVDVVEDVMVGQPD
jgi:hypothetical protein